MAKQLRHITGVKSSKVEKLDLKDWDKSPEGAALTAKYHSVEKHADRVGNGDDVYKGKTKEAPYKKASVAEAKDDEKNYNPSDEKWDADDFKVTKQWPKNGGFPKGPKKDPWDKSPKKQTKKKVSEEFELGEGDVTDLGQKRDERRLANFHKTFMGDVRSGAKEIAARIQDHIDAGHFPMKVGTRFSTEHSRRNKLPPFKVTGYYVDKKNPEGRYGYHVDNGETQTIHMIKDPGLEKMAGPDKWKELQAGVQEYKPLKSVKENLLANIRAKYGIKEASCNHTNEGTYCEVHGGEACPSDDKKEKKGRRLLIDKKKIQEAIMNETAPPSKKLENWIKANKERFYKEYGEEKGKKVLYATAWRMHGQAESGSNPSTNTDYAGPGAAGWTTGRHDTGTL